MDIIDQVKKTFDLDTELAKNISPYCKIIELKAGDLIVKQGDKNRDLYSILSGELVLEQKATHLKEKISFGKLEAGDLFGELSFIDGEARFCDVVAVKPTTLLKITEQIITEDSNLYKDIAYKLLNKSTKRIRDTSGTLVDSLFKQILLLQEKERMSRLFVSCVFLFMLMMIVNRLLNTYNINPYSSTFAWLYAIVLALPLSIVMVTNKVDLRYAGLNFDGIGKKMVSNFLVALPIIVIMYFFAAVMRDKPLYDIIDLIDPNRNYKIFYFRYTLIAFFQEFFRSVMQMCVKEIFLYYPDLESIIMSSFIFAILHIHLGFHAIGLTFLAGLLFGYTYLKQKNIYSVTFLHALLGAAAFTLHLI